MIKASKKILSAAALAVATSLSTAGGAFADKISFMVIGYNEPGLGEWWQKLVAEYEKTTGNTVEIVNTPAAEYYSQLTLLAATDSAPDVIVINANNVSELTANGTLLPIDDFVARPGNKDKLVEGAWDNLAVDGKFYGVPITGRTLELIYNSCYLKEAGFQNPPTTPEEFMSMAKALTVRDASNNVTRYGANMVNANEDPTYEMLLMWTLAFGGTLTDDEGKFLMTSEPVVKALTYMKTLYDEGVVPRGLTETEQRSLFATGATAMTIDGQWQFPFIEKNNAANYDCYKSARHPWSGPATGGTNQGLGINAKAANPEAAWAFLETAMSPAMQQIFSDYSPYIPYGVGALTPAQLEARPYLTPWAESLPTASPIVPRGHEDEFNTIWPIVAEAVIASLHDGKAPAEALAEAQAQLEECCSE
ncbi:MAG: sugar ABC transporter substrate-binding protein [Rhizobiaceae bacterium]|nr:sugar ABC transporter substrate-binding protein [Rhizobiaceae bacterium]